MHSGLLQWDWRHISVSIQRHAGAAALCDHVGHYRHIAVCWYACLHTCFVTDLLADDDALQQKPPHKC